VRLSRVDREPVGVGVLLFEGGADAVKEKKVVTLRLARAEPLKEPLPVEVEDTLEEGEAPALRDTRAVSVIAPEDAVAAPEVGVERAEGEVRSEEEGEMERDARAVRVPPNIVPLTTGAPAEGVTSGESVASAEKEPPHRLGA